MEVLLGKVYDLPKPLHTTRNTDNMEKKVMQNPLKFLSKYDLPKLVSTCRKIGRLITKIKVK